MEFLGKDGWPAPRLKDAGLSESKARELYRSVLVSVHKMFHLCKLVHGDLSEYNMLYHQVVTPVPPVIPSGSTTCSTTR